MKKLTLLLVCVTFMFAKEQYSVDELILQALENSPDIAISKLDVAKAKEKKRQAFSGYLPKVDLLGSYSYTTIKELPLTQNDISDSLLSGSITLQQLLYDFGKVGATHKSSKEIVKLYDASLAESILQKKKEVKVNYYTVLKSKALIDVAKESIKLNEAQLHRAQKYFAAGIRTKVDISDAKVQLIQAKIALQNTLYDLKTNYATLNRIIGFDAYKEYDVYMINLEQFLSQPLPQPTYDLKQSISYAYQNRPQLQTYYYQLQAQKELQSVATSAYYPELYLQANYTTTKAEEYGTFLDDTRYGAGVMASWNIYSGGKDKAKIQEQHLQTLQAQKQLAQKKLLIEEEVTKAYIAVYKSKEQITLAKNLLSLSKEKFDQVTKQYEHGLSDYIELQVARQGYIDAKSNLVINLYDYYIALAILEATIGQ